MFFGENKIIMLDEIKNIVKNMLKTKKTASTGPSQISLVWFG